jgi:hypothetical protein
VLYFLTTNAVNTTNTSITSLESFLISIHYNINPGSKNDTSVSSHFTDILNFIASSKTCLATNALITALELPFTMIFTITSQSTNYQKMDNEHTFQSKISSTLEPQSVYLYYYQQPQNLLF